MLPCFVGVLLLVLVCWFLLMALGVNVVYLCLVVLVLALSSWSLVAVFIVCNVKQKKAEIRLKLCCAVVCCVMFCCVLSRLVLCFVVLNTVARFIQPKEKHPLLTTSQGGKCRAYTFCAQHLVLHSIFILHFARIAFYKEAYKKLPTFGREDGGKSG